MIQEYLPQIIASAILLLLSPISKLSTRKLILAYGSKTKRNERRIAHMIRVVAMIINFMLLLLLAVVWGVDTKDMLIVLSSIFAVIGVAMFAQWSILSNITAGIIIFFSTPFRIGDEINILDKEMPIKGVIEDIFTFHIHLRTKEGELIVIPNTLFLQKIVSVEEPGW